MDAIGHDDDAAFDAAFDEREDDSSGNWEIVNGISGGIVISGGNDIANGVAFDENETESENVNEDNIFFDGSDDDSDDGSNDDAFYDSDDDDGSDGDDNGNDDNGNDGNVIKFSDYFCFGNIELDSNGRITFVYLSKLHIFDYYDLPPIIACLQKLEGIDVRSCQSLPIEQWHIATPQKNKFRILSTLDLRRYGLRGQPDRKPPGYRKEN